MITLALLIAAVVLFLASMVVPHPYLTPIGLACLAAALLAERTLGGP